MSAQNKLRKAKSLAKTGDFLAARRLLVDVLGDFPANTRAREALAALDHPEPSRPGTGPTRPEIEHVLLLFQQGRFGEMLGTAKPLAGRYPGVAVLHSLIGGAYSRLDMRDEALDALNRALVLNPNDADARNAIGVVLTSMNRNGEALLHLGEAVRLRPDHADALANMAIAYENTGQNAAALDAVDKALAINPRDANALRFKSTLRTFAADDGQIAQIEAALAQAPPDSGDALRLHFALGKAHDDIGNHDRAFRHFSAGNRIRRASLGDVIAETETDFAEIRRVFSGAFPVCAPDANGDNHRMVFVIGMPRSGTTLVEQILASHSKVFGAGELDFMRREARRFLRNDTTPPAARLEVLRKNYLRAVADLDPRRPVVVDKMPTNFIWTGFILSAFPDARVIRMKRNPAAVCWSIFRRYFPAGGLDFGWDLEDLVAYHRLYEDLMGFWHARFPGRIVDLDYEVLTENQKRETRKLLDVCGLDFEPACLQFHETRRAVNTASTEQVRRKMYTGSSGEWRRYEKHLGILADAFGAPA